MMEYGTPSTPEELDACDSSENGIICILKDLGSKFGKFVTRYIDRYMMDDEEEALVLCFIVN